MTGADLKKIREATGLSIAEFGRALGYNGTHRNVRKQVLDMEAGKRTIREDQCAAAHELDALVFLRNYGNGIDFGGGTHPGLRQAVRRLIAQGHVTGSDRAASATPAGLARIGQ